VVFFTGLSGAGKSTLARMLSDHLLATGERSITVLDGDHVRRLLSAGLGFGPAGRDQNVRRIGFVAAEVARHGGVAICAPIAPYEQSRTAARRMVEQVGDFVLVHVATSLADCEARDVKGLYARARAGELSEFTGISDPYEVPADAELRIETAGRTPSESLEQVLSYLRTGGWLTEPAE
jgi:sulfate adenylyltransferase